MLEERDGYYAAGRRCVLIWCAGSSRNGKPSPLANGEGIAERFWLRWGERANGIFAKPRKKPSVTELGVVMIAEVWPCKASDGTGTPQGW